MSLNDSLNPVERAKLAVWDYPVSEQFTKLMDSMFVPNYYKEALNMVKTGKFAFIGKRALLVCTTVFSLNTSSLYIAFITFS